MVTRYRQIALRLGLGLAIASIGGGLALPGAEAQQTIEIPPHEFEKHMTRFDSSTMSQEEMMKVMGLMYRGIRGGGDNAVQSADAGTAPAASGAGTTSLAPSGGKSVAVFPEIPAAVAADSRTLGRWLLFQAEIMQKLGEVYGQYGQELLQESAPSSKPEPAKSKKK